MGSKFDPDLFCAAAGEYALSLIAGRARSLLRFGGGEESPDSAGQDGRWKRR